MKTREQEAFSWVARTKSKGITVKELDIKSSYPPHHGATSAALSSLHKKGLITRLKDKREDCGIYVLPEWTKGRETKSQGFAKSDTCTREDCASMEQMWIESVNEVRNLKAVLKSRGISYA